MNYREICEDFNTIDFTDRFGRYDPKKDDITRRSLSDTRKPKLTLADINRLKKIRSTRELELTQQGRVLELMFSQPEEDESSF